MRRIKTRKFTTETQRHREERENFFLEKKPILFRQFFYFLLFTFYFLLPACRYPDPGGSLPPGGDLPRQENPGPNPPDYAAFVVTSDFGLTGGMADIGLDTRVPYFPDWEWAARVVSPDAVATTFLDRIFVINRYTYDSISVLDQKLKLSAQYSVADPSCDPSNPHDLAFVSATRAFLSRYECHDLWVINPQTGQRLDAIDLKAAGFGGADGIPEMSGLLLLGNTLYVAVQTIDRRVWKPEGPGRLVTIDAATDAVTGAIVLFGANPVTDVIYSDSLGAILVGTAGNQRVTGDGGIEAVDPSSGTALGFVITEDELKGTVSDFVIAGADRGFATVTGEDFRSTLVRFNPATGKRDPAALYAADSGFTLWDLALNDRGEVWLCDRSAARPGLQVFDAATGARLTAAPIDTGLPPFSIVFLK